MFDVTIETNNQAEGNNYAVGNPYTHQLNIISDNALVPVKSRY